MKYLNRTLALGALICVTSFTSQAEDCCKPSAAKPTVASSKDVDRHAIPADRISLFTVPLKCAAAPEIGCGSLSKPLLLDLEEQSGVTGAWLNQTGTILALIGNENFRRDDRLQAVKSAAEKRKIVATEVTGAARERALKDFHSAKRWHRGAGVDELSRTEAGIIAARLVRRVKEKTPLPDDKANSLRVAFTQVFEKCFSKGDVSEPRDELLRIGREQLDSDATAALQAAIAPGYRPLPGEK